MRLLKSPNGLLPLAGHRIQGITKQVVRDWFTEVSRTVNQTTGKPNATQASRAYAFLKAVLKTAVQDDLIEENPCAVWGASNLTSNVKKNVKVLKMDELKVILANLNDWYQALIVIAALGGLRFGEIIALTREDVDTSGDIVAIRVSSGVTHVPGKGWVRDTTKNDDDRTVLIPEYRDLIVSHLEKYVGPEKTALVFKPKTGEYLAPSTMTKHWYRARAVAGRQDFPFHSLRHFASTVFTLVPGVTEKELMERMGHKTRSASWIYQHTTGREMELAEKMKLVPGIGDLLAK
jgi:integrase